MSPYHRGGAFLSAGFGGPSTPDAVVFLVSVLLLLAGWWLTRRVYPGIFEKE